MQSLFCRIAVRLMWSIVADQVAWSVGLSVTAVSPTKNCWTDRDAVCVLGADGHKESCIR